MSLEQRCCEALYALEDAGVIEPRWHAGRRYRALGSPDRGVYRVLDLSDPITSASLVVLVREAWGDPDVYCERIFTGEWVVIDGKGNAVRFPKGATEVEALVAALEAKVREIKLYPSVVEKP
ncbi:MAG: hypothetical protein P1V36_00245 [Planctomycetota bacterium]|nr:hypothetical protein [Planctomycetota bacterium]